MPVSLQKNERTKLVVDKVKSGELVVTGTNLLEVRRETDNVATTNPILLDVELSKAIIDSYNYFNTPHNTGIVSMVISEIREVYKLHCLPEIIQAIKNGRRTQGSLYGKLSPGHIMEWIRDFDEKNTPTLEDKTELRRAGMREDFYADAMTEEEREVFEALANNFNPNRTQGREFTHEQKAQAAMERHTEISDEEWRRREHGRAWRFAKDGDYETYMKKYDAEQAI